MSTESIVSSALSSVVNAAKPPVGVDETELVLGLLKTAFYFTCLFISWYHSLRDLFAVGRPRFLILSILLFVFGLWNVVEAWILIFQWLQREYKEAYTAAEASEFLYGAAGGGGVAATFHWTKWFNDINLFVQAYEMVVETFTHWFWSSQLLHFVPTLVVFTYVEFPRAGATRPFSNFLLGCLAAISLCFPYVLHIALNSKRSMRRARMVIPVGRFLILCMLVSTAATIVLPRVHNEFTLTLAVLHGALLAPLFFAQLFPSFFFPLNSTAKTQQQLRKKGGGPAVLGAWWVVITYSVLAGMAGIVHFMNFITVVGNFFSPQGGGGLNPEVAPTTQLVRHLAQVFCANECQCSISNDVVRTSAVFMLVLGWLIVFPDSARRHGEGGPNSASNMVLFFLTPVLSVGATFPLWAALREARFILQPFTYEERVMAMVLTYFDPATTYAEKEEGDDKKKKNTKSKSEILEEQVRRHALKTLAPYVATGQEELLVQRLVTKYGIEPHHRQQLLDLLSGSYPQPQESGAEQASRLKNQKKMRNYLTQFYTFQLMEDKLATVEVVAAKWAERGGSQLKKALMGKYPDAFTADGIIIDKRQ